MNSFCLLILALISFVLSDINLPLDGYLGLDEDWLPLTEYCINDKCHVYSPLKHIGLVYFEEQDYGNYTLSKHDGSMALFSLCDENENKLFNNTLVVYVEDERTVEDIIEVSIPDGTHTISSYKCKIMYLRSISEKTESYIYKTKGNCTVISSREESNYTLSFIWDKALNYLNVVGNWVWRT